MLDVITQWGLFIAVPVACVMIYLYGRRKHQRWLATIHQPLTTHSYVVHGKTGTVHTIVPPPPRPYDWQQEPFDWRQEEQYG